MRIRSLSLLLSLCVALAGLLSACATDPLDQPTTTSAEQASESVMRPPGSCTYSQGLTCFTQEVCGSAICGSEPGYCDFLTSCCVCGGVD
jgi:hypothetical protein